ncbi:hypothetical protein NV226_01220 [Mycoplasma iguanae]|uniref:DUF31 domain-containing protein n=1 Tax=Mycoplasma iguanae TaxID=292461 RepID=A0ABY5RCG8_9MOLU|nr:hypothetical protein [Mycoplasma iguanae]UVD81910.1 hypothetical protein NV226_01220 [Mycoplasma iguanae]
MKKSKKITFLSYSFSLLSLSGLILSSCTSYTLVDKNREKNDKKSANTENENKNATNDSNEEKIPPSVESNPEQPNDPTPDEKSNPEQEIKEPKTEQSSAESHNTTPTEPETSAPKIDEKQEEKKSDPESENKPATPPNNTDLWDLSKYYFEDYGFDAGRRFPNAYPSIPVENTPKIEEEKPAEPEIVSKPSSDYEFDRNQLRDFVKNNSSGYTAKAVADALKEKKEQADDVEFLNKLIKAKTGNNKNFNWSDISNFNFIIDNEQGKLVISFLFVGENHEKVEITLTTADGLKTVADLYDHIKKLSMNLDVIYASVALGTTSENPDYTDSAINNANGVLLPSQLNDGSQYINVSGGSGTAWILDRIVQENDEDSDTLTYLVGTNVHVGSYANAFIGTYQISDPKNPDQPKEVNIALDPLAISYQWRRNYKNPRKYHNGFVGTFSNPNDVALVTNLQFGTSVLRRNTSFINQINDLRRGRNQSLKTWFKSNDLLEQQKAQFLDSIFYQPQHQTEVTVGGNTFTYNSLGSDFIVLKMTLNKKDLRQKWNELWTAFTNKTEKDLFLKISNNKVLDMNQEFYSGGYPGYSTSNNSSMDQYIYRQEKYNAMRHGVGNFWKATTLSPFTGKLKSLLTPNLNFEEGLDPESYYPNTELITGQLPRRVNENDLLLYIDKYTNQADFEKIWKNRVNVNEEIDGNQMPENQFENTIAAQLNARDKGENKILIKKVYSTAKRHLVEADEFVKGGSSGSMVIDAKMRIVGILSAVVPGYITQGYKNGIFYDFNNTYSKIKGNMHYGAEITKKIKDQSIKTVLLNNEDEQKQD